ncbi:hypothetical protein Tco_0308059 [Tanacetum coccineum]
MSSASSSSELIWLIVTSSGHQLTLIQVRFPNGRFCSGSLRYYRIVLQGALVSYPFLASHRLSYAVQQGTMELGLQVICFRYHNLYAEAEYRGVANVVAETAWIRNLLFRKDNKDKSEQNQSKPTKKRKRQDKSEEWKPILNAGSARYNKKRVNEEPIEEKGLIMSSFKITRAHLDD